jgi:hypothetical protein
VLQQVQTQIAAKKKAKKQTKEREKLLSTFEKNPSKLSDSQLNTLQNRLQKEQSIKSLTGSSNSTSSKKTKVSSMTNDELSAGIKRMQLEKQYTNLSKEQKNANKSAVQKALEDGGKTSLKVAATKATTYAVNYGIKKASDSSTSVNWKEFADFVAPTGKKTVTK